MVAEQNLKSCHTRSHYVCKSLSNFTNFYVQYLVLCMPLLTSAVFVFSSCKTSNPYRSSLCIRKMAVSSGTSFSFPSMVRSYRIHSRSR